jgi:proteasome lid subunit RPN8/RPN11
MIEITDSTFEEIKEHAKQEYPKESCGVLLIVKGKEQYLPCRNIAQGLDFAIHPEDYAQAEDMGEITAIIHSHPNISPKPSQADLIGCENSGLPWLIINWPTGLTYQFEPSGYKAPLIGRKYVWGVTDCFTLIKDYYKEELDIDIKDVERSPNFWHEGKNLYLDNYEKEGFVVVDELQKHDVILMQVRSGLPNHGAVYIGDGLILQHFDNRLSSRDVYGGLYQKVTTHILRHRSLL